MCVHAFPGDQSEIDAEIVNCGYKNEYDLVDHATRIALLLLRERQYAELHFWRCGETEQVPLEEFMEQLSAPEEPQDEYLFLSEKNSHIFYIESPQLLELQQRLGLESSSQALCYSVALLLFIHEYLSDGWIIAAKMNDEFIPMELPSKDQKAL